MLRAIQLDGVSKCLKVLTQKKWRGRRENKLADDAQKMLQTGAITNSRLRQCILAIYHHIFVKNADKRMALESLMKCTKELSKTAVILQHLGSAGCMRQSHEVDIRMMNANKQRNVFIIDKFLVIIHNNHKVTKTFNNQDPVVLVMKKSIGRRLFVLWSLILPLSCKLQIGNLPLSLSPVKRKRQETILVLKSNFPNLLFHHKPRPSTIIQWSKDSRFVASVAATFRNEYSDMIKHFNKGIRLPVTELRHYVIYFTHGMTTRTLEKHDQVKTLAKSNDQTVGTRATYGQTVDNSLSIRSGDKLVVQPVMRLVNSAITWHSLFHDIITNGTKPFAFEANDVFVEPVLDKRSLVRIDAFEERQLMQVCKQLGHDSWREEQLEMISRIHEGKSGSKSANLFVVGCGKGKTDAILGAGLLEMVIDPNKISHMIVLTPFISTAENWIDVIRKKLGKSYPNFLHIIDAGHKDVEISDECKIILISSGMIESHVVKTALKYRLGLVSACIVDEAHAFLDQISFRASLETIPVFYKYLKCSVFLLSATYSVKLEQTAKKQLIEVSEFETLNPLRYPTEVPHLSLQLMQVQSLQSSEDIVLSIIPIIDKFVDPDSKQKCMVFLKTRRLCEQVSEMIKEEVNDSVKVYFTHGADENQANTLSEFFRSTHSILFSTTCTAQGVDDPNVTLVICAYVCEEVNTLAQMGGRAGRQGQSSSFYLLFDKNIISEKMETFSVYKAKGCVRLALYKLLDGEDRCLDCTDTSRKAELCSYCKQLGDADNEDENIDIDDKSVVSDCDKDSVLNVEKVVMENEFVTPEQMEPITSISPLLMKQVTEAVRSTIVIEKEEEFKKQVKVESLKLKKQQDEFKKQVKVESLKLKKQQEEFRKEVQVKNHRLKKQQEELKKQVQETKLENLRLKQEVQRLNRVVEEHDALLKSSDYPTPQSSTLAPTLAIEQAPPSPAVASPKRKKTKLSEGISLQMEVPSSEDIIKRFLQVLTWIYEPSKKCGFGLLEASPIPCGDYCFHSGKHGYKFCMSHHKYMTRCTRCIAMHHIKDCQIRKLLEESQFEEVCKRCLVYKDSRYGDPYHIQDVCHYYDRKQPSDTEWRQKYHGEMMSNKLKYLDEKDACGSGFGELIPQTLGTLFMKKKGAGDYVDYLRDMLTVNETTLCPNYVKEIADCYEIVEKNFNL